MPHITQSELTAYLVENQARFYRLAYSYLHDREEALDAVQTAVCKALEKQDGLKNADAHSIWFYRILVNVCTGSAAPEKARGAGAPGGTGHGQLRRPASADGTLAQRVEGLPPEVAAIVKLRFYEELSLKEISTVVNCR